MRTPIPLTRRTLDTALLALLGTSAAAAAGAALVDGLQLLGERSTLAATVAAGVSAVTAVAAVVVKVVSARRTASADAVWDALHDLSAGVFGEDDAGALLLDEALGDEAAAWNQMVETRGERQALRAEREAIEALTKASGGGSGGFDVLDLLPHGVLVLGVGGRVEAVNAAGAMFLRSTREKLVGALFSDLGTDASVGELVDGLRVPGSSRRAAVEVREAGEAEHGPSVFRYSARRAGRGEAGSVVLMIEDVTQQRLADESRTTLMASAAHELRTPLTNIRLWVEEYVDAAEDDESTRNEAINVIGQESRRLERIVSDVLSVSELEAGSIRLHFGDVRLDAMLKELESDFRMQAEEKSITMSFDLPPRVPVVQGDRDRFELVLHNLVGNALKYTPVGGSVSVSLEETDREVVIEVRDTGFGIADGEQDKVFERFYRAVDERLDGITGTGLGLAIAREIVRRHGGDITLSSKLNEGSTFSVRVPKAQARAQAA